MDLNRLDRRSFAAVAMLVVVSLVAVAALVVGIHRLSVASQIDGLLADPLRSRTAALAVLASARASDSASHTVGWVWLVTYVACALTFLRWFREAYRNTAGFGVGVSSSVTMATWSWIIPFVSLVRPRRLTQEIWVGSAIPGRGDQNEGEKLLNWWWGIWIIAGILAAVARFDAPDAADPQASVSSLTGHIRSSTEIALVSYLLMIAAAVLAVRVIQMITRRQRARARVDFGPLSSYPPNAVAVSGDTVPTNQPGLGAPPVSASPAPAVSLWQDWSGPADNSAFTPPQPAPEPPASQDESSPRDTRGSVPPPGFTGS